MGELVRTLFNIHTHYTVNMDHNWTPYCAASGLKHESLNSEKFCPHCGTSNPNYKSVRNYANAIVIEDSPEGSSSQITPATSSQISLSIPSRRFEAVQDRTATNVRQKINQRNAHAGTETLSSKAMMIKDEHGKKKSGYQNIRTTVTLYRRELLVTLNGDTEISRDQLTFNRLGKFSS